LVEFWRRWHISLSSWLRDYVYIPLGGSRIVRKNESESARSHRRSVAFGLVTLLDGMRQGVEPVLSAVSQG